MITVLRVVLALVAVCAVVVLAILVARRQWLLSRGGIFSCEVRRKLRGPGMRWSGGLARYAGNSLLWYTMTSTSFRPTLVIRRRGTHILEYRAATVQDGLAGINHHEIARLQIHTPGGVERTVDVGLASGSLTGLMSWLEAGPPGGDSYAEYDGD